MHRCCILRYLVPYITTSITAKVSVHVNGAAVFLWSPNPHRCNTYLQCNDPGNDPCYPNLQLTEISNVIFVMSAAGMTTLYVPVLVLDVVEIKHHA